VALACRGRHSNGRGARSLFTLPHRVLDRLAFAELFDERTFRAADFEIVYGIIAQWRGNEQLVDRLPFFSKVNLVNRARRLRRIGYSVTYSPIGVRP